MKARPFTPLTSRLTNEEIASVRREARETFLYLGSKLVDGDPAPSPPAAPGRSREGAGRRAGPMAFRREPCR